MDDLEDQLEMSDFKASVVAFEVQKNFANKFFSNKTVAKSLIDETSGNLLDNLYLLLFVFVSIVSKIYLIFIDFLSRQRTRRNQRRPQET